ncbi:hypothetical protein N1851_013449 [Merluccius polli]|uniref:Uncharacterized protein n=1 Tax=Merluccius polli TaxID=89951 RepID=A0AA47MW44_MERPO|nr:hypothetical protein N1851_013449 [Merluccius polli]
MATNVTGGNRHDIRVKKRNDDNDSRSSNTVNSMRKRLRRLVSSAHIRITPSPVSSMMSLATVLQNLACIRTGHTTTISWHQRMQTRDRGKEFHLNSKSYFQVFDGVAAVVHGHKVLLTFVRILHLILEKPQGTAPGPHVNPAAEGPITCGEVVLDPEAHALQLVVAVEAHPHEAPAGEHQTRAGRATEAVDERGEAEGAVAHLDVVEAALERRLDVEAPVELQLYPLPWNALITFTQLHIHTWKAAQYNHSLTCCPLSSSIGAVGVKGLAQGPLIEKVKPSTHQISLVLAEHGLQNEKRMKGCWDNSDGDQEEEALLAAPGAPLAAPGAPLAAPGAPLAAPGALLATMADRQRDLPPWMSLKEKKEKEKPKQAIRKSRKVSR